MYEVSLTAVEVNVPHADNWLVVDLAFAAITGLFSIPHGLSYKRYVVSYAARSLFRNTTVRQMQYGLIPQDSGSDQVFADSPPRALTKPSVNEYQHFAMIKDFEPIVTYLEDGTPLCWFGDSNAKKAVLWFYGTHSGRSLSHC